MVRGAFCPQSSLTLCWALTLNSSASSSPSDSWHPKRYGRAPTSLTYSTDSQYFSCYLSTTRSQLIHCYALLARYPFHPPCGPRGPHPLWHHQRPPGRCRHSGQGRLYYDWNGFKKGKYIPYSAGYVTKKESFEIGERRALLFYAHDHFRLHLLLRLQGS